MEKKQLEKATKKGLFDDLLCSKCETENKVNWKEEKVNGSGVWYYCKNCEHLNLVGWDTIN